MNAKRKIAGKVWMLALAPGLLAASSADAGHPQKRRVWNNEPTKRVWHKGHDHRVWVEPVYEIRRRVVEVPAVYETRARRIWHEPIYEYRQVSIGRRGGISFHGGRGSRHGGFHLDIGIGGRDARRTERVLIRAGYWETVYENVLVRRATTRIVEEKVLVRAGYWRDGYDGRVIPVRHRGHYGGHTGGGFRASIGHGEVRVGYRR